MQNNRLLIDANWLFRGFGVALLFYYCLFAGDLALAADSSFGGSFDGFAIQQGTPTTPDVDAYITFPSHALAPPSGSVTVPVTFGNLGMTRAENVRIKANFYDGLSYVSDDSGITPTVVGSEVIWFVNDLDFAQTDGFSLTLDLPNVPLGTGMTMYISIDSNGPEGMPNNNIDSLTATAASQAFLPFAVNFP